MSDYDALLALAKAATPGPWYTEEEAARHRAFIAACSPDVVTALVERVREAEAESASAYTAFGLVWKGLYTDNNVRRDIVGRFNGEHDFRSALGAWRNASKLRRQKKTKEWRDLEWQRNCVGARLATLEAAARAVLAWRDHAVDGADFKQPTLAHALMRLTAALDARPQEGA